MFSDNIELTQKRFQELWAAKENVFVLNAFPSFGCILFSEYCKEKNTFLEFTGNSENVILHFKKNLNKDKS